MQGKKSGKRRRKEILTKQIKSSLYRKLTPKGIELAPPYEGVLLNDGDTEKFIVLNVSPLYLYYLNELAQLIGKPFNEIMEDTFEEAISVIIHEYVALILMVEARELRKRKIKPTMDLLAQGDSINRENREKRFLPEEILHEAVILLKERLEETETLDDMERGDNGSVVLRLRNLKEQGIHHPEGSLRQSAHKRRGRKPRCSVKEINEGVRSSVGNPKPGKRNTNDKLFKENENDQ